MGIYHQIGHNSINLVKEKNLNHFSGLIWSPVNYTQEKVSGNNHTLPKDFAKTFDPQLYFPDGEKRNLLAWDYYPEDFETADITSRTFWDTISKKLVDTCVNTDCRFLCSPVAIPKHCGLDYYNFFNDCAEYTSELAETKGVSVFQTVVLKLDQIDREGCIEEIASVVSRTKAAGVYLVFESSTTPRRELHDAEQLLAAMKIIHYLRCSGHRVVVGFCSSDFALWRYAGASDIATGKYFNIRRFTATRFLEDDTGGGGGQLPYLYDNSFIAFLREGDVLRLDRLGLLDREIESNPYNIEILNIVRSRSRKAWVALSWCSYLYSIMKLEEDYKEHDERIKSNLEAAEKKWVELQRKGVLMEEIPNNGSWIREWRIALNEFDRLISE